MAQRLATLMIIMKTYGKWLQYCLRLIEIRFLRLSSMLQQFAIIFCQYHQFIRYLNDHRKNLHQIVADVCTVHYIFVRMSKRVLSVCLMLGVEQYTETRVFMI